VQTLSRAAQAVVETRLFGNRAAGRMQP